MNTRSKFRAHDPRVAPATGFDPHRRRVLQAGAAVLLSRAGGAAHAQSAYPERPITVFCPWTAGGNTDIALRSLADAFSRVIGGKRILIENKPGAGGALGAQHVAQTARPDGYTLSQAPVGVFRLPYITKTSFNPLTDLTWIICVAGYNFGVSVRADSPFKTWQDVIAHARANPGKLRYGSPGVGTSLHVTMEDLAGREKVQWTHVPYKGTNQSTAALKGGEVDVMAGTPPWSLVSAGEVRPLMTWSAERPARAKDVPTLNELYGIVVNSPWGIVGPKGMDPQIVAFLHDNIRKAMADPSFLKTLDRLGQEPYYMGGAQYAEFAAKMYASEKEVVQRLGLDRKR